MTMTFNARLHAASTKVCLCALSLLPPVEFTSWIAVTPVCVRHINQFPLLSPVRPELRSLSRGIVWSGLKDAQSQPLDCISPPPPPPPKLSLNTNLLTQACTCWLNVNIWYRCSVNIRATAPFTQNIRTLHRTAPCCTEQSRISQWQITRRIVVFNICKIWWI